MGFISKGDLLILDGKVTAIALGGDFTELYYDEEAKEMLARGIDWGVARGAVNVLIPSTGVEERVALTRIAKPVEV